MAAALPERSKPSSQRVFAPATIKWIVVVGLASDCGLPPCAGRRPARGRTHRASQGGAKDGQPAPMVPQGGLWEWKAAGGLLC